MDEVLDHYDRYDEAGRLFGALGVLELARTKEILLRHLSPAPAVILDVGGGPGVYSLWLASKGYEVHLVEVVPKHVEQARLASEAQRDHPIASIRLGDARELPQDNGVADALLLLGPLYHLTGRIERRLALNEANRVLRPGGLLVAAAISRFASLMVALADGRIDDADFFQIVDRDLHEGQHRNTTGNLDYFTTAFFHRPDELREEVSEAGFESIEVLPVEGPAWMAPDFEQRWADPRRREQLLALVRRTEDESSLLGMSHHLLATGRRI